MKCPKCKMTDKVTLNENSYECSRCQTSFVDQAGRPDYVAPLHKVNVRFVEVRGVKYLRAEDVKAYLDELAGSEETDVRARLQAAADNLLKPTGYDSRPIGSYK